MMEKKELEPAGRVSRMSNDRASGLRYAANLMNRRAVILIVLIAVLFQGPTLSYAVTLGAADGMPVSQSTSAFCGASRAAGFEQCDSCCSHGFMLSCAASCLISADAAGPLSAPVVLRSPVRSVLLPDPDVTRFVDHHPPHLLRPPIL